MYREHQANITNECNTKRMHDGNMSSLHYRNLWNEAICSLHRVFAVLGVQPIKVGCPRATVVTSYPVCCTRGMSWSEANVLCKLVGKLFES